MIGNTWDNWIITSGLFYLPHLSTSFSPANNLFEREELVVNMDNTGPHHKTKFNLLKVIREIEMFLHSVMTVLKIFIINML